MVQQRLGHTTYGQASSQFQPRNTLMAKHASLMATAKGVFDQSHPNKMPKHASIPNMSTLIKPQPLLDHQKAPPANPTVSKDKETKPPQQAKRPPMMSQKQYILWKNQ